MASNMKNVLFALGPNGRYFYNSPAEWARNKMPAEIEQAFVNEQVGDVKCVAFGDDDQNYFFLYTRKRVDGSVHNSAFYGSKVPTDIREWLLAKERGNMDDMHVVLGPNDSFVAWDPGSIVWNNIPRGLEKTFQSWLSPAGWTVGPPRLVALGKEMSYFALSQYGASSYWIPLQMTAMCEAFSVLERKEGFHWKSLHYIAFDPSVSNRYIIVFNTTMVQGSGVMSEDYKRVADSFAADSVKGFYQRERKSAEAATRKKEADDRRARAKESEAKKARMKSAMEETLRVHYKTWVSTYEAAFTSETPLKDFPHLPRKICVCTIQGCVIRKRETGLDACRHDVESLLRAGASGKYSYAFLRTERLRWHPDMFGRRCDESHRERLQRMSSELYTIFEELIAAESVANGGAGG